jgi:hypothetical protein
VKSEVKASDILKIVKLLVYGSEYEFQIKKDGGDVLGCEFNYVCMKEELATPVYITV